MMMERGHTGTEHLLGGGLNSSNYMIPMLQAAGSNERLNPLSQNHIVKRDLEIRGKFKTYLEGLFQDLCMRDNGGKEMKIDHYYFLKVIFILSQYSTRGSQYTCRNDYFNLCRTFLRLLIGVEH